MAARMIDLVVLAVLCPFTQGMFADVHASGFGDK